MADDCTEPKMITLVIPADELGLLHYAARQFAKKKERAAEKQTDPERKARDVMYVRKFRSAISRIRQAEKNA